MALGIIAMSTKGVPVYGAMEGPGGNAVEPPPGSQITDAQYWWGHSAPTNDWHYHHPHLGNDVKPTPANILSYALDGFPIMGPLDDASGLDECNGRAVDGEYRYHVRSLDQVEDLLPYCNGNSEVVNWGYSVSCFKGNLTQTVVDSYRVRSVPSDCVVVDGSTF
jgi:hypothetical protein